MKVRNVMVVSVAMAVGVMLGGVVRPAVAAFFDRDKLAHALAVRFNLNEQEASNFLADFQYNPDGVVSTSTPTPTPTATPVPPIVKEGITYKYDDYTDKYYPARRIVGVQRQNNLDFIEGELDVEANNGRMTQKLENKILDKLVEQMEASPSSEEFEQMRLLTQRSAIAKFKKEMDGWLREQGMTLAELREITGKGNKFLMGIYLE